MKKTLKDTYTREIRIAFDHQEIEDVLREYALSQVHDTGNAKVTVSLEGGDRLCEAHVTVRVETKTAAEVSQSTLAQLDTAIEHAQEILQLLKLERKEILPQDNDDEKETS